MNDMPAKGSRNINSKTELVKFRLTKDELNILKEKMSSSGHETFSSYLRYKAFGKVKRAAKRL